MALIRICDIKDCNKEAKNVHFELVNCKNDKEIIDIDLCFDHSIEILNDLVNHQMSMESKAFWYSDTKHRL